MDRYYGHRLHIPDPIGNRPSRLANNPADRPKIGVSPLKYAELRVPITTHVKSMPNTRIRIETAEETFAVKNPGTSFSTDLPFGRSEVQNVEHAVFTPLTKLPLIPHREIGVGGGRTIGGGNSTEALSRARKKQRRRA